MIAQSILFANAKRAEKTAALHIRRTRLSLMKLPDEAFDHPGSSSSAGSGFGIGIERRHGFRDYSAKTQDYLVRVRVFMDFHVYI